VHFRVIYRLYKTPLDGNVAVLSVTHTGLFQRHYANANCVASRMIPVHES